jgi:site-specific DNA recombinase
MKNNNSLTALIYCRVSSQRQVDEGSGLDSQETRCRNYCKGKEYLVEKVFQEEGVSGDLFDRPAMNELLQYIDDNTHKNYVVVFDDLKRFARNHKVHFRLKLEFIETRSVKLECLNFDFKDTPESEYVELILAGHAELERKQNRQQVINKMKARLDRGYWPFCPPTGLKNKKSEVHGKILFSHEPFATIFKKAIEGYAHNVLNTQHQVRDFINKKYSENNLDETISLHGVERLLVNPLYAGLIEYARWEVPMKKAQHNGFITEEVFKIVQEKLAGKSKPKLNKTFNADFPLRRFVTCEACGSKLRASWNGNGKGKHYPNYWCQNKDCEFCYKVTKAPAMHEDFEAILQSARVEGSCLDLSKAIFNEVWEFKKTEWHDANQNCVYRQRDLNKKISSLTDRIANASNEAVVAAYETRIEELSDELKDISQASATKKKFDKKSFNHCWNQVGEQLKNPLLLWKSPNLEDKRTVLHMYFNEGLSWHYEKGFGTAKFADEINLLQDISEGKIPDVEMAGYEPASASEQEHHLQT